MTTIPDRTIVASEPLPAIEALDRLDTLQRDAEFLATSRGELNVAFGMLDVIEKPGGAARQLAEIAQHQTRYGADPLRAQIAVTRELAGYALRARIDRTGLKTLQEEVAEMPLHHNFAYINEASLRTGRGAMARYIDLRRLAREKDPTAFPFSPLREYSKGQRDAYDVYTVGSPRPEVATRIAHVLGHIRSKDAPGLVTGAVKDQENRFAFWRDRVAEVEAHQARAVSLVARKLLREDLGVKAG